VAKPTHADAELLLHLYEIRREPELRQARKWLLTEFKSTTWAEVKQRYLSHVDEDRWFRMATSYWEMVATMVNRGVLHAELFFDHTGEELATWERIKGVIPDARADIRPTYLMQFEKLVVAHQAYRKKTTAAALAAPGRTVAAPAAARRPRGRQAR
jgi:hypothetical protein